MENLGLETRETREKGWTWRDCAGGGGKLGGTRNKRVKEGGREPEESWKRGSDEKQVRPERVKEAGREPEESWERGSDEKQQRPDERSWRGTRGKLEERLGRETRETG
jgi:hypothetical protein